MKRDSTKSMKRGDTAVSGGRPIDLAVEPQAGRSRSQILQSFRTLRDRRRTADESEIVIEEIVKKRGKGSLHEDVSNHKADAGL